MGGLEDLWTTLTNELSFGVLGMAGADIPDFWAGVIINWSAVIAGIVMLMMLLYGGFLYLTSTGEPQKTEQAQKTLVNAVIGFVIVVLAWSITSLVMTLFGVRSRGNSEEERIPDGGECWEDWDCDSGRCSDNVCI